MITAMRKLVFLVVMSLVLLAGLFGWAIKMEAAHPFPLHPAGHTLAVIQPYCPPAPYDCQ